MCFVQTFYSIYSVKLGMAGSDKNYGKLDAIATVTIYQLSKDRIDYLSFEYIDYLVVLILEICYEKDITFVEYYAQSDIDNKKYIAAFNTEYTKFGYGETKHCAYRVLMR